ncbi:MAG: V-type ATPase subunit [Clostridiales bacterium]|nr:V-type ATPase subunit [Clostridiales bacterium]
MKDTAYVYAVGRIRVKELSLLSSTDIKRLIGAKSYREAAAMLESSGYEIHSEDYSDALNRRKAEVWQLMKEVLPDIHDMDSLIVKNDFSNMKAAIKTTITGADPKEFMLTPCVYTPEEICKAVSDRNFSALPEMMSKAGEKAYDILARTSSAQLSDAVIDKAAMKAMLSLAKKADNEMLSQIAECTVACADIKTAYRCILAEKNTDFMKYAISSCGAFESREIIQRAAMGMDEFLSWLEKTDYSGAAAALRLSSTAFEKYCDDRITEITQKGKNTSFGITPIVAYYIACETEILTLRIILSGKLNNVPADTISARARETYV